MGFARDSNFVYPHPLHCVPDQLSDELLMTIWLVPSLHISLIYLYTLTDPLSVAYAEMRTWSVKMWQPWSLPQYCNLKIEILPSMWPYICIRPNSLLWLSKQCNFVQQDFSNSYVGSSWLESGVNLSDFRGFTFMNPYFFLFLLSPLNLSPSDVWYFLIVWWYLCVLKEMASVQVKQIQLVLGEIPKGHSFKFQLHVHRHCVPFILDLTCIQT